MFVVTPEGVIATDPDRLRAPAGGRHYVEEIRRSPTADQDLIYSHHQLRSHRGRQAVPGRRRENHRAQKAKERLAVLKDPATPPPT